MEHHQFLWKKQKIIILYGKNRETSIYIFKKVENHQFIFLKAENHQIIFRKKSRKPETKKKKILWKKSFV